MKKLLILGGSAYILPVIKKAHELGIYVITCDYLPHNVAHRYSDEYKNISIIDKDAVLTMAQEEKIDGVISFACDPGVVTAAYVAENMGLPFQCSYESACILQDKGKFRKFLSDHHFNTPFARRYEDSKAPFFDLSSFKWPVMVKPVDSAGSKGVTKVDRPEDLEPAVKEALEASLSHAFIIEEFLTFEGHHSSTDPFTIDGKIKFITYSDHFFDGKADNPYAPIRIIIPSTMAEDHQTELTEETQRLMKLLDMKTGLYNVETCIANGGRPYLMEISPRGGGCDIALLEELAYGVDLIGNEIRKAVSMPLIPIRQHEIGGAWSELVVHTNKGGILKKIEIDPEVERDHVRMIQLTARPGDLVEPFSGANKSLGNVFLQYDTREELDQTLAEGDLVKVVVENQL